MEQPESVSSLDVYTALEKSSQESTRYVSEDLIRAAASPRARSCLQGLVERYFHPIHLREYYSVLSLLLLQLYLVRREHSEVNELNRSLEDHLTRMKRRVGDLESGNAEETARLKRRIQELMKENSEYARKCQELYKINQHWAIDYEDLSKQLLRKSPECVVSKCANCTLLERELEEKKMLIRDQQGSLDKYHARKAEWKAREQELQTIKNENKALKLQIHEIGGISSALTMREEKEKLVQELTRVKDKYRTSEVERSRLQTQINHFKQNVWQFLFAPVPPTMVGNGAAVGSGTTRYDYQKDSGHSYSNGTLPRTKKYVSIPPPASSSKLPLHTNSNYEVPATPPGYISRTPELGVNPHGSNPSQPSLVHQHHHPYKPHSIEQQVTGFEQSFPRLGRSTQSDGGVALLASKAAGNADLLRSGSSQYLAIPPTEQGPGLPSPLNIPRPLSAPGGLQLNAYEYQNGCVVPTPPPNKFTALSGIAGTNSTHPPELFHPKNTHPDGQLTVSRPQTLPVVSDMSSHCMENGGPSDHTHYPTVNPKLNSDSLRCSKCGAVFPRQPELFDRWFDHVTSQCPSNTKK